MGVPIKTLKPFTDHIDVVTFFDNRRWSYVRNGRFEKWLMKGLLVTPAAESGKILVEGLDENYRVVQDGMVSMQCDSPYWVSEEF